MLCHFFLFIFSVCVGGLSTPLVLLFFFVVVVFWPKDRRFFWVLLCRSIMKNHRNVIGFYRAFFGSFLLCCICAEGVVVINFMAVLDSHKMKQTANGECLVRGGNLAMDTTAAFHLKIVETIRTVATGKYYYAFLGGSMSPSRGLGCPESYELRASLDCVWFWNEGIYEEDNLQFYRGNLHPNANRNSPGLSGAGGLAGIPTYWYTLRDEQIHPAEKYLYSIMLVSTKDTQDQWVDNNDGPGFEYDRKASGLFYAACMVFPDVQPPEPGDGKGSVSVPSDSSTSGTRKGGPSAGQIAGSIFFFAGIFIFVMVVFVCCCCRKKVMNCLCCRKNRNNLDDSLDEELPYSSDSTRRQLSMSEKTASARSLQRTMSNLSHRGLTQPSRSCNLLNEDDYKKSNRSRSGSSSSLTLTKRKKSGRELFWDSDSD